MESTLLPSRKKTCALVIGDCGTGKSTLVNIFGDGSAAVSSSSDSETKNCEIYQDQQEPSRMFIDTRGLEDTYGVDDDETYREIMRTMHTNGIQKVQIVWMTEQSQRQKEHLQTQAKFISSVGDFGRGRTSVWESVLVVIKKCDLDPFDSDKQGVLAVARKYGAMGDIPVIGYTALDHLCGKEQEKRLSQARRADNQTRRENGLLYDQEIHDNVDIRLRQLGWISLAFVDKKCRKCGMVGDERCVPRGCHTRKVRCHRLPNQFTHPKGFMESVICPNNHVISGRVDGTSDGQTYRCSECHFRTSLLFRCDACRKHYCGDQSCAPVYDKFFAAVAVVDVVGTLGLVLLREDFRTFLDSVINQTRCCRVASVYPCCGGFQGARGCSYACCEQTIGTWGSECMEVCNRCERKWGTRGSHPCDLHSSHNMR